MQIPIGPTAAFHNFMTFDRSAGGRRAFYFIYFHLFIRHKGYKREKKMKKKKVLLFTISWRGSPKEASRLIENGLPQINK